MDNWHVMRQKEGGKNLTSWESCSSGFNSVSFEFLTCLQFQGSNSPIR